MDRLRSREFHAGDEGMCLGIRLVHVESARRAHDQKVAQRDERRCLVALQLSDVAKRFVVYTNAAALQRSNAAAHAAPTSCAAMKPGASAGRIPANVSVSVRATVTAGFANEVDGVNQ